MPCAGIPRKLHGSPQALLATGTTGLPPRPSSSDGWPARSSLSSFAATALHYRSAQATRRCARLLSSVPLSLQGGAAGQHRHHTCSSRRSDRSPKDIRKRTVGNYSCDIPQVCSTEGDERPAAPSDEINPSGTPRVSSYAGKKKNTSSFSQSTSASALRHGETPPQP